MTDRIAQDPNFHTHSLDDSPSRFAAAAALLVPFAEKKAKGNPFLLARHCAMVCDIVVTCSSLKVDEEAKVFFPEFLGRDFQTASAAAYDIVVLTGYHVMFKFNDMKVKITPDSALSWGQS